MKAKELIGALKEVNPEAKVVFKSFEDSGTFYLSVDEVNPLWLLNDRSYGYRLVPYDTSKELELCVVLS